MFKNLKLAAKISLGFSLLLLIAIALGGLATWNMLSVKTVANDLATKEVPEVGIANEIERDSLLTMYATRGYAYTEDAKFLDEARTNLAEMKKGIQQAREHGEKTGMADLVENAAKVSAKAAEYEDSKANRHPGLRMRCRPSSRRTPSPWQRSFHSSEPGCLDQTVCESASSSRDETILHRCIPKDPKSIAGTDFRGSAPPFHGR